MIVIDDPNLGLQPQLASSITTVSDAPNCSITYDRHYDDRNSFIIQATDCSASPHLKYFYFLSIFPSFSLHSQPTTISSSLYIYTLLISIPYVFSINFLNLSLFLSFTPPPHLSVFISPSPSLCLFRTFLSSVSPLSPPLVSFQFL